MGSNKVENPSSYEKEIRSSFHQALQKERSRNTEEVAGLGDTKNEEGGQLKSGQKEALPSRGEEIVHRNPCNGNYKKRGMPDKGDTE